MQQAINVTSNQLMKKTRVKKVSENGEGQKSQTARTSETVGGQNQQKMHAQEILETAANSLLKFPNYPLKTPVPRFYILSNQLKW